MTDPTVGRLIHVSLHFAGVLYKVVDSSVTQSRQVRRGKYCLYTAHTNTQTHVIAMHTFTEWPQSKRKNSPSFRAFAQP